MPKIIFPSREKTETNTRYGEASSPYCPAPLLETPDAIPQQIILKAKRLSFKSARHSSAVDQHLTNVLRESSLGLFEVDVSYHDLQSGNYPLVDCYMRETRFAIGARTTMLHNQFGIGPLILDLLDKSPLYIMTPLDMEWRFSEVLKNLGRRGDQTEFETVVSLNLFPSWIHDMHDETLPNDLPPVISSILEECMNTQHREGEVERCDDEIGFWPLATCSWYGLQAYKSKLSKIFNVNQQYLTGVTPEGRDRILDRDTGYDQGEGTDPTWMVLDDLCGGMNQEVYAHTCSPIIHDPEEFEDMLRSFRPFAKLLKYLSHRTL